MTTPIDFQHDIDTDVVTICGIRYAGSLFRDAPKDQVGMYFRVEARFDGTVARRGFSKDLQEKFDKLAGIK